MSAAFTSEALEESGRTGGGNASRPGNLASLIKDELYLPCWPFINRIEKIFVCFMLTHLIDQELHTLNGIHRC